MKVDFNLTGELNKAKPGGEVSIPSGEFSGTWIIEKPITLTGLGKSSVLWSPHGPILRLKSPGIILDSLSIEVTEDLNTPSLIIENLLNPQPIFNQVHIVGKPEGGIFNNTWKIPEIINFGTMMPNEIVHRTIGVYLPRPVKISSNLVGLTIQYQEGSETQAALILTFDTTIVRAGALFDGLLEIETQGINSYIRLVGEIISSSFTVANSKHFIDDRLKIMDQKSGQKSAIQEKPQNQELNVSETLEKALELEEQELFEKEVKLLSTALKSYPKNATLHARMALVREKMGNLDKACSEWEIVYEQAPDFPDIIDILTLSYKKCNKEEALIVFYEKLVREKIANVTVFQGLAMLYSKVNRKEEAKWALRQAQNMKFDQKLQKLLDLWEKQ
jgi:hypothetical protein